MEGRESGFHFSVFEYCVTKGYWNTGALVQLEVAPPSYRTAFWKSDESSSVRASEEANTKIGPRTADAFRTAFGILDMTSLAGLTVEIGSDALLVRAVRSPLDAKETPAFLDVAFSLSTAVVEDERRSSRRAPHDGSADTGVTRLAQRAGM